MSNFSSSDFLLSRQEHSRITANLKNVLRENMRRAFSVPNFSACIAEQLHGKIDTTATYTICIPEKHQKAVNEGKLRFMCDAASGLPNGQLIDEEGKIRGKITLRKAASKPDVSSEEKRFQYQVEAVKRHHNAVIGQFNQLKLQNMAIMQQLMQITETVNDIRTRVIALQDAHDDDLIGGMMGIKEELLQIRDTRQLELQRPLLANAIHDLNRDRGRIQQALLRALNEMPDVPRTGFILFCKLATKDSYASEIEENFSRAQRLFSLYLTATMLLGYAYAFAGEERAYGDVFMPSPELMNHPGLTKLVRAERIFAELPEDTWYKQPDQYLGRIGRKAQQMITNNDEIQLYLTGEELEEVLTYDTAGLEV